MRVLTVNAGSSTLKLALVQADDRVLVQRELRAGADGADPGELRDCLQDGLGEADAVGHRIVHGGERFREPVRVDGAVRDELGRLTELAPLHQPKSLRALDEVSRLLPSLPAVACFDTAFHATLQPPAATYALPEQWRQRWGLRRFGFHGLSHAWVSTRAPEMLGVDPAGVRIVSCHLGAGASLCAIAGGRSVDTTMGFTPLEGLVMATRSGSVDPGLLVWLLQDGRMDPRELAEALERRSGLLALCGSADMAVVTRRADDGDARARAALDVYLHRLRAAIAAMAASLAGIDVLAFTGGVGERSAAVRAGAAAGLEFLGVSLDVARNAEIRSADADISADAAAVRTIVLAAREDLELARSTRAVLSAHRA